MNGSIEVIAVRSSALTGNPLGDPAGRLTPVYLPPCYEDGTARYPVVYFLHGFSGSGLAWLNRTAFAPTVPERMDRLIAARRIPPCIGVFVDGWTTLGGSQWIDSEAIGRYREYVAVDVVAWADRTWRTLPDAASRAVIGKSSGGYGALVMGCHHPDVFGVVGCHAGDAGFEYCLLPELPKAAAAFLAAGGYEPWLGRFLERARDAKPARDDHTAILILAMAAAYSPRRGAPLGLELPFEPETARLRPAVWDRWLAHDPVRFVPRCRDAVARLRAVFLDCGTRDEFNLRWGARMVARELQDAGAPVVHEEFDDGHRGIDYRYERSLAELVPRLARG